MHQPASTIPAAVVEPQSSRFTLEFAMRSMAACRVHFAHGEDFWAYGAPIMGQMQLLEQQFRMNTALQGHVGFNVATTTPVESARASGPSAVQSETDIPIRYADRSAHNMAASSTDHVALASDTDHGAAVTSDSGTAALVAAPGPERMRHTYPYEADRSLPTDKWVRFDHPKIGNLFARIEILPLGEYLELSNQALLLGTRFEVPWLQDNKYYVAPELRNLKIWAGDNHLRLKPALTG